MFSSKLPVARKPICTPANCVIILKKETGEFVVDPATGNQTPKTEEVTLQASVTFYNSKQKIDSPQGSTINDFPVTGFLVNPCVPPQGFRIEGVVPMIYSYANGDREVGFLTVENIHTAFEKNITQVLGTPIRGVFSRTQK